MSRKASSWILFAVLSAVALTFAVRLFPRAFPIVSVDLRMDRSHAIVSTRSVAERLRLGPSSPVREATWFGVDDTVKTFVELEGGGAEVFRDMLARHLYEAYTWRVRRFRSGEARELVVRFRPDGAPYGFREKLREDAPGAALARDVARGIAERSAERDWQLDLAPFDLVETSTETRPGGRVDHTFVYQRRDASVGEGRYRVRLVVAGEHLSELTHYLRVPQSFDRRYEKLRASNDAIAFGATVALALLYIIGGCIIGLVLLMRRRWVVWTPAFVLGVVIAGVQALASVNGWPLEWMFYDTAVPPSAFMLQRIMQVLLVFLADGGVIMLSFAAAESLGRLAFPRHPQLWSLWSPEARGSRQVLGRTVGGVLLTGIEFGYIIGFYILVTRLWKWWTPAEALVDPNVLATRLPWLAAFAPSLHAGMWEEALFRAVPLAGAALIGDRLGNRKLWIVIGLVVEALVFGCAHANYPSEPAFARPVELFVPSLVWGLIYLRFGLLPSMITHYLFDLSLFGLPLFTSSAAGNRVDQVALVLVGALPLLLVAGAALRRRPLADMPETLRNGAWTPPAEDAVDLDVAPIPITRAGLTATRGRVLLALGVAGLAIWAVAGPFHTDAPGLRIRRPQAIATGEHALGSRGFDPAPKWRRMATVDPDDDELQSTFVWRALGPDMYRKLIGKDLTPPVWKLRVASFEGDVVERAEEWRAWIDGDGTLRRTRHELPQGRPGASLDEAAARALAQRELMSGFELAPGQVREVSAVSDRQPSRLDWTFTFADTAPPRLTRGERRIAVGIAGDQVSDAHRFVFVPEDWQRQQRGTDSVLGVLALIRALAIAVVVLTGAVLAAIAWSRRWLRPGFTLRCFALLAILGLVIAANRWPQLEASMVTARPYSLQVSIFVVALTVVQLISAAVMALLAGWVHLELGLATRADEHAGTSPLQGLALGATLAGVLTLIGLVPAGSPRLPNIDAAQTWLPWLGESLRPALSMFMRIAVVSALLAAARMLSSGWTRRAAGVAVLLVVVGGLAATPAAAATPALWLAQAALAGLGLLAIEWFVLRHDPRLVPWAFAALTILSCVRVFVVAAHPDARLGAALGVLMAALLAQWWTRELVRAPAAVSHPVPVTEPSV